MSAVQGMECVRLKFASVKILEEKNIFGKNAANLIARNLAKIFWLRNWLQIYSSLVI